MSTDYLGSLTASNTQEIKYNKTEFEDKLTEVDDGTLGNKNDKIDVNELKEVFQEMGLSSSEARELAKYFFNKDNGFMKSNDGGLDIAKVFEFLDSDDGDSNVSTSELKTTKPTANKNTRPTSDNKQETTIGEGKDAFTIKEQHRKIAMDMVKPDGTLDTEALQEYLTGNPPPNENDKKAVVFLALLAAGYNEDDILENLNNIIKQLETQETTESDNKDKKLTKAEAKEKISNHVDGRNVDEDGLEEEIAKMFTDMGMGEEIAHKLAKAYMESPEFEKAKSKGSEEEIVDAIREGLFKFLGKEKDDTIDPQDVFEDGGKGQVKENVLKKMGGGLENLSSPPTEDEVTELLGSGDISLEDDEALGQLIEIMLGANATPENVDKVRAKLKEELGGDTASATDIFDVLSDIVDDVKNAKNGKEGKEGVVVEPSDKSYKGSEFADKIKGKDGHIDVGKLEKELLGLGLDPEIAKEFAKTFAGKPISEIIKTLDDDDGNISSKSVQDAINKQSLTRDEFKKKITKEDGKTDYDALEDVLLSMGVNPDHARTMVEQLKSSGATPDMIANLFDDDRGSVTAASVQNHVKESIDETASEKQGDWIRNYTRLKDDILASSGINPNDGTINEDFQKEFTSQFGHLSNDKIKLMLDMNGDGKLDNKDIDGLRALTKDDLNRSKQLGKIDSFRLNGDDNTKVNQLNDSDKAEILKILRLSGVTESDGTPHELSDINDMTMGQIKYMMNNQ